MIVLFGVSIRAVSQTTVEFTPIKDNTIFSESNTESNGAGTILYVGKTGTNNGGALRRSLVKFDISSLPQNVIITEAKLTMATVQAPASQQDTYHTFTLHKVTKDWGEGTSLSTAGAGGPATINDVTWYFTFYPTNATAWQNLGGDYVSMASATTTTRLNEICEWVSQGLIDDVNNWRNTPSSNFGWIIRGQESTAYSAKGFASRTYLAVLRPKLTITYTTPPVDNVLINELNPQKKWIELYNPSSPTVNLSNYWLANGATTAQITNTNVLNGNLILNSGEYVVLNWANIGQNDGELALYNGNPATNGTVMKDYIQYGSGSHQRASAAVTAQAWESSTAFLPTISADTSSYSLNGANTYASGLVTSSTDFVVQRQTPTLRNLTCLSSISLSSNLIDSKYTSSGVVNITGSATSSSKIQLISQQSVLLNNLLLIPNGAVFEAKIGNCSSE